MSAMKPEQNQDYPTNANRLYGVKISIRFGFRGTLNLEKVKECMYNVECKGAWGENRNGWEWCFEGGTSSVFLANHGHGSESYDIWTGCKIKHSQIHAFENFVVGLVKKLVENFPGLQVGAQPQFTSVAFALGSCFE